MMELPPICKDDPPQEQLRVALSWRKVAKEMKDSDLLSAAQLELDRIRDEYGLDYSLNALRLPSLRNPASKRTRLK
jgi:hypothetical protein